MFARSGNPSQESEKPERALEIVLDRGLEDDWFASNFIITMSAVCALAFVLMISWEISRRNPMIDMRMVATRQFGCCFLVMLATGAILLATTQFLPQLAQQNFGYTATWAGLVLSPGGAVTMVMMFIVGRISGKVQLKYKILPVHGALAHAARRRTSAHFPAITTASYDGIPPDKTDQASALINAVRNIGGSIAVSLVSNVLAHLVDPWRRYRAY